MEYVEKLNNICFEMAFACSNLSMRLSRFYKLICAHWLEESKCQLDFQLKTVTQLLNVHTKIVFDTCDECVWLKSFVD